MRDENFSTRKYARRRNARRKSADENLQTKICPTKKCGTKICHGIQARSYQFLKQIDDLIPGDLGQLSLLRRIRMLSKEEYRISYNKGQKIILCDRLDVLNGMDEELLEGTLFAYKCPAEKESAYNWKKMFENFSRRSFTMTSSYCRNKMRSVFMGRLGCVHRRNYRRFRKAPCSKRDFGCPFMLKVNVRIPEAKRSKNPTRGGYNLRVYSNRQAHNHSLELALKYRRVGPAARAALNELFNQYHTPDSAMEVLKMRLFARLGDDYLAEASDRAVLPDKGSVTRLYYETYRERYGDLTRKQVRRLQEDAARKRRWLSAREDGERERTLAPGADTAVHFTPPRCGKKEEQAGDDFMDAFDEPADLPGVGWIGTQISFGQPTASAVAAPSADCTAVSGADMVASAESTVAQSPQNVIICYADSEEADAASATLVELAEGVPLPAADKTDVVGDALVAAVGVEGNVAAAAAGTGGVLSAPAGDLLAPLGSIGPATAMLDLVLPSAGEPAAAAVGPGVPSAEQLSSQLAKWASGLQRQLAADGDGQWRAVAASFLESWELLPAPGRLKALGQFGRVTGLSRPADSPKAPTSRRTETTATQTDAEGSKPDADSLASSPFFRSLCVLRSENDVASISLRRIPRVASVLERRKPIFIRGVRE